MEDGQQAAGEKQPPKGFEKWNDYWTAKGMPWRTKPEIDDTRKQFLAEKRAIEPNSEKGVYPFKDTELTRADVEWLLVTHESGQWPFQWGRLSPGQRRRGLDLRGANLRKVDLRRLPLMQLRGGLSGDQWTANAPPNAEAAAIHLEGANLQLANLQDATLRNAHLEGAILLSTRLEGAILRGAQLGGATIHVHDRGALEFPPTDLRFSFMDSETNLRQVCLGDMEHGFAKLSDIHWGGVDLTMVPWAEVDILGDEQEAQRTLTPLEETKSTEMRLEEHLAAVRANRQLATLLRAQGLNEEADRFAYRAQRLQTKVFKMQGRCAQWFFWSFLRWLAGYGYQPLFTIGWYVGILLISTAMYCWQGAIFAHPHMPGQDILGTALVDAFTALHGRGFFPTPAESGWQMGTAAFDAVAGLTIEASFIATFTQRFFGK